MDKDQKKSVFLGGKSQPSTPSPSMPVGIDGDRERREGLGRREADSQPAQVDLRALATTVRTAMRNGHPDATKHLDALLTALGA